MDQVLEVSRCDECDKEFKNEQGLRGHNRLKHGSTIRTTAPVSAVVSAKLEKGKKKYPYRGMGVNENANLRMVMMVQPLCPVDDRPTTVKFVGGERVEVENPAYSGEQSCQAGRYREGWWNECEALGHNPYYTKRVSYVVRDVVDETGMVTGSERRRVEKIMPNTVPVAISIRHNSGHRVEDNKKRGYLLLTELGYEQLCEMRGCELPVTLVCRFGSFCSERHARLIAADVKKISLVVQPDTELSRWAEDREEQLSEIQLGKVTYVR